jgi:hypothetical protein
MRRKLFVLTLILAAAFAVYLPAQAKDSKAVNDDVVSGKITLTNALAQVRYVRIRGKRYKVWYKTFTRRGRRYVRVYRVQRA